MKIQKILTLAGTFFLIFSCTSKPSVKHHGSINLYEKQNLIEIQKSNKNDVINLFGETILKEFPNDNIWIYIETLEKNSFFGNRSTEKNYVLVLEFDKKGILLSKSMLDKNDMKDLKFDQTKTDVQSINDSFSKRLLSSIKKRFQAKSNQSND